MAENGTPTTLAWYVDALDTDAEFASECEAEATALVENFIGATIPDSPAAGDKIGTYRVPVTIARRAVLDVAANLYYRRLSNNGAVSLESVDPTPFRHNRNPMAPAYPLLRPFVPAL